MSVSEIIAQTEHKMKATVEHTREEFVKIRTGRASTGLLDQIKVDYYGCPTPLNQVAQVGVGDARTLTVQPWEKNMVKVVEKGDPRFRPRSQPGHVGRRDPRSVAPSHRRTPP